jgi:hypothetical protein
MKYISGTIVGIGKIIGWVLIFFGSMVIFDWIILPLLEKF